MHDRGVWSVSLGHWGNVHVRLHMVFLLFAAFTFYLGWQGDQQHGGNSMIWIGVISVLILFISVVLHELGHYFAAQRLGGHLDTIVIGPLGGLRPARVPHDPQGELLAVLAGPLTNLVVTLICLAAILIDQTTSIQGLWNPIAPDGLLGPAGLEIEINWLIIVRLTCWINWMLVLFNLLPAFPFDGARAVLAICMAAKPDLEYRRAAQLVALVAKVFAFVLVMLAWASRDAFSNYSAVPAWLALTIMAIFVFFAARVEEFPTEPAEAEDDLFGYDFSQGYTSLERSSQRHGRSRGLLSQWLEQKRLERRARQAEREASEEAQMDVILQRLHEVGMDGLTAKEQTILKRVSARYRSREKK